MQANLDALPTAVHRYLRLALSGPTSSKAPATLVFAQQGSLRTSMQNPRWVPFTATHTVRPLAHEFDWCARVRMAPLVYLSIEDSFRLGVGSSEARFGWLQLSHAEDTREVNAGSLHRFLAEAVFCPWALLPSPTLKWSPIDDARALATLTVGATTVSLEFRFAEGGEVSSVFTAGRWGRFGSKYLQVPWEGHFQDYALLRGVFAPSYGEVGWWRGGRLELVWRGRLRRIQPKGELA